MVSNNVIYIYGLAFKVDYGVQCSKGQLQPQTEVTQRIFCFLHAVFVLLVFCTTTSPQGLHARCSCWFIQQCCITYIPCTDSSTVPRILVWEQLSSRNKATKVEVQLITSPFRQHSPNSYTTANNVCTEGLITNSADLTAWDLFFSIRITAKIDNFITAHGYEIIVTI